ncbi:MAG: YoaK family protein [Terriglobales bacterium]
MRQFGSCWLRPAKNIESEEASGWELLDKTLPPLLAGVGGTVDVIGFLSFKFFAAHVTGNLVVIAAVLVGGGPINPAQILAVPVFLIAVAVVWWIAKVSGKSGPSLARPLLLVQFVLLIGVLTFSVSGNPAANPHGLSACIAGMIAVSAMASQFALLRLALPDCPPSTAVMTGNLTNAVLSLLDTFAQGSPLLPGSGEQLRKTLPLVGGFLMGCLLGAFAVSWFGNWAWSLPVILAGVALMLSYAVNEQSASYEPQQLGRSGLPEGRFGA